MSVQPTTVRSARGSPSRPYTQISLVELIERVFEGGDGAALDELHNPRTPFRAGAQPRRLTLTAFVMALCEMPWLRQLCGHDQQVIERAYELTMDRFSSLPPASEGNHRVPSHSADCRRYLGSALEAVRSWAAAYGPVHELELEAVAPVKKATRRRWARRGAKA